MPVLVKLITASESYRRSLCFDGRFLHKAGVREEIKKAWLTNHPLFKTNVSDRLKSYRKALSKWKKKENFNSRDKIKQIQCALELEQSTMFPTISITHFLKMELIHAYKKEKYFLEAEVQR